MRKRIGFAVLLGFLVGYPFELSARPIKAQEKKLINIFVLEEIKHPAIYELRVGKPGI